MNLLRPVLLAAACAVAVPSHAADRCEHSRTETPALDLAGVTRVELSISLDELILKPGSPSLRVEHCASSAERVNSRTVKVERRGDVLHVSTGGTGYEISWFGNDSYTYARLDMQLPADLPVSLDVGSGDAAVTGLSDLRVTIGSGDVALHQVGVVRADIGSGDLVVDGATRASVDVGSGDAVLQRVQGEVRASVGSGDVRLEDVGPLPALSAGSGSIVAERVRGAARIDSVGSGDISLRGVAGEVQVETVGSGDVVLREVEGDVAVADADTLENVSTRGIRGRVIVGG